MWSAKCVQHGPVAPAEVILRELAYSWPQSAVSPAKTGKPGSHQKTSP